MDSAAFKIGDRVRLKHDVDHLANVCVPEGSLGTVTDSGDERTLAVRLDVPIDGLEDWWNELLFPTFDGDDPASYIESAGVLVPPADALHMAEALDFLITIDEGENTDRELLDRLHDLLVGNVPA